MNSPNWLDAEVAEMLALVIQAELICSATGQCEISVPLEITGQFAEVCGATASTFCMECRIELCPKHVYRFGMTNYCEYCGEKAEAAMLPLLNEWKAGQA